MPGVGATSFFFNFFHFCVVVQHLVRKTDAKENSFKNTMNNICTKHSGSNCPDIPAYEAEALRTIYYVCNWMPPEYVYIVLCVHVIVFIRLPKITFQKPLLIQFDVVSGESLLAIDRCAHMMDSES